MSLRKNGEEDKEAPHRDRSCSDAHELVRHAHSSSQQKQKPQKRSGHQHHHHGSSRPRSKSVDVHRHHSTSSPFHKKKYAFHHRQQHQHGRNNSPQFLIEHTTTTPKKLQGNMWIRPAGPVPFLFPTLTNGSSNDHVSLSECQATMSNDKDGGVMISSSSPLKFGGDTTSTRPAHQIVPNGTTIFYASPTTSLSYDDDDELLHSLSNNNNNTAPHNATMLSNNCAASSFEPYSGGGSSSSSRKQGQGNMVNFGESGKPIKPRATYLEEEYV